jgi:hypothetical protein
MVKNHLSDSELIQIGFEEDTISGDLYRDEMSKDIEIFCEPCFDLFKEKVEASHESHNVEMCYDCYMEFNE